MGTLAIIDIRQADGQTRQIEINAWPVRIGRALDNDIVLNDPYVAAHHLTLDTQAENLALCVGDTVNGVRVENTPVPAGASGMWRTGSPLHLGKTVLHVRLRDATVPAELPLKQLQSGTLSLALLLIAVFVATGLQAWLEASQEQALWRTLLPVLLVLALLLGLWVGGWALASKLFTKHLDAARHVRIALIGLLVIVLGGELLSLAAFMFNLPALDRYAAPFYFAAFGMLAYAHLGVIVPARGRLRILAIGVPTLAMISAYWLGRYNSTSSLADKHFMTVLHPASWRAAESAPLDRFIADSAALQHKLDALSGDTDEESREYPE